MSKNSPNSHFFIRMPCIPSRLLVTRAELVQNRINCAMKRFKNGEFTETTFPFTFSNNHESIRNGAFVIVFRVVECPNDTRYYQLNVESLKKGPQFEVLSFFEGPLFKDPTAGDAMFKGYLPEIQEILSELNFEPSVFLRIARILVPQCYHVTMHLEQPLKDDGDFTKQFQRLNPFSIPVDFFSFPTRPVKRPRIQQFVEEDSQAVEVVEAVEEERNQSPNKRRRF